MTDSSETAAATEPHTAPLFVVVEGVSAGFAVRDGGSLQFRAIDPRFQILDGSRFARTEQVRLAARRVAKASRD